MLIFYVHEASLEHPVYLTIIALTIRILWLLYQSTCALSLSLYFFLINSGSIYAVKENKMYVLKLL